MAPVVLVHGIWNRQRGMTPQEAAIGLAGANREHLAAGLAAAGLSSVALPEVVMAYYAHLLDDAPAERQGGADDGLLSLSDAELAELWEWLVVAGVPEPEEAQAYLYVPVRQAFGWLVGQRAGAGVAAQVRQQLAERVSRLVLATLREIDAYTSRPQLRRAVRDHVAGVIREHRPSVVIAHSLGSVVAYEALHAHPDLEVELLVTLGSPLGLPALLRKLDPVPQAGLGSRPAGVERWVNIADVGDFIAVPPELGGAFPVDQHETVDRGVLEPHLLGKYLSHGMTAAAIAPYLSA